MSLTDCITDRRCCQLHLHHWHDSCQDLAPSILISHFPCRPPIPLRILDHRWSPRFMDHRHNVALHLRLQAHQSDFQLQALCCPDDSLQNQKPQRSYYPWVLQYHHRLCPARSTSPHGVEVARHYQEEAWSGCGVRHGDLVRRTPHGPIPNLSRPPAFRSWTLSAANIAIVSICAVSIVRQWMLYNTNKYDTYYNTRVKIWSTSLPFSLDPPQHTSFSTCPTLHQS